MIWQSQQKDFLVVPGLFQFGARGGGDTAGMHLPVYKMNFPRKNPMKMAAMTTRREGREAALASRPRRLVEFDVMWSERGTFLILIVSSCKRGRAEMKAISAAGPTGHQQVCPIQSNNWGEKTSPNWLDLLKLSQMWCHFYIDECFKCASHPIILLAPSVHTYTQYVLMGMVKQ